ncbi:hypothetical protein G3480_14520 [Thiorhodococcus mannitoliphagus]|uniref:Toprim domain-containing protein n=2 Tax=Thiorhodococcus mannitoliphagus TaxID=329406 RepID=A0A6P1DTS2_9GAMM|nr:hypothetical protein [Thiorhodococcus mannitoliphagus]
MPYPEGCKLAGCAIRLAEARSELGIAEGIETALAVQMMTGTPIWAAGSATLLETFDPPTPIEKLTIWADRDQSGRGEKAAQRLKERLARRGLAVEVRLPPIVSNAKKVSINCFPMRAMPPEIPPSPPLRKGGSC